MGNYGYKSYNILSPRNTVYIKKNCYLYGVVLCIVDYFPFSVRYLGCSWAVLQGVNSYGIGHDTCSFFTQKSFSIQRLYSYSYCLVIFIRILVNTHYID